MGGVKNENRKWFTPDPPDPKNNNRKERNVDEVMLNLSAIL